MRHGEAVASAGSDYARALTDAGQLHIVRQAERLLGSAYALPTHLIASSAKRTASTAAMFASVLAKPMTLMMQPNLYRADADGYRMAVSALSDTIECAMFVGHNPAVSYLVQSLTYTQSIDLPPAGMCVLHTEQPWHLAQVFQLVAQYND